MPKSPGLIPKPRLKTGIHIVPTDAPDSISTDPPAAYASF